VEFDGITVVIGFRLYGMERGIDMIGKKIAAPLGAASADGLKQIVRSFAGAAQEKEARSNSYPLAGFTPTVRMAVEGGVCPVNTEGWLRTRTEARRG
jgi:hypothetical protein